MKRAALLTLVLTFSIFLFAGTALAKTKDGSSCIKEKEEVPRLDVVFVIDATGSMGDEIEDVKKQLWTMATELMAGNPQPDIRFGLVFYRDTSDATPIETTPLTRDVQSVQSALNAAVASGGGDWEEHVGRGLHEALDLEWDTDANVAKLMYLVGDAPGHDDYQDGYEIERAISRATEMGIVIHAIGGSGLDAGVDEFKEIAKLTDGTYTGLTYHTVIADEDGNKQSVIYADGEYYEADGVLSDEEWQKGGADLLKEKKVKKAKKKNRSKAKAKASSATNNLSRKMQDSVQEEAMDMGVVY